MQCTPPEPEPTTLTLEQLPREDRKKGFQLTLISQQLKDFSEEIIKLSTTRFILGQPEPSEIEEIRNNFNLSETDLAALSSNLVHGPGKNGSAFLISFTTREGTYSQVVRMKKGPLELWSYSTTPEDNEVTKQVLKILGPDKYLQALRYSYPSGSIVKEYNRRVSAMSKKEAEFITQEKQTSILDTIANEIAEMWIEHERETGTAA